MGGGVKRIAAILLLTGCASHTAQIAQSASYVRGSVQVARDHIDAARVELDAIQREAEAVSVNVGHVSDDENPLVVAMKYGFFTVVALGIIGAAWFIKTRI